MWHWLLALVALRYFRDTLARNFDDAFNFVEVMYKILLASFPDRVSLLVGVVLF